MTRRLALTAVLGLALAGLAPAPANGQDRVDEGEWEGSVVERPAPVTSDAGSTVVEGRFVRDRPFSQPTIQVTVSPPPELDPSCPDSASRTFPATATAEDSSTVERYAYDFSAVVKFGPGACNGTYPVVVEANRPFGEDPPVLETAIDVAIAPPPVLDVQAERVGGREVEVTWAEPAAPSPDFIGFAIIRTSSTGEVTSFDVDDPDATSFRDTEPPAEGGETTYQVVGRRSAPGGEVRGSGGDALTPVEVDPAPEEPPDGDDGQTDGGTSTTQPPRPAGSAGPGIRPPSVGSGSRFPPLPRTSPPSTVDDGFDETLPFGDRELGDADAVLPDDLASSIFNDEAGRGLVIPVATALLLAVWAFHLRYLVKVSGGLG